MSSSSPNPNLNWAFRHQGLTTNFSWEQSVKLVVCRGILWATNTTDGSNAASSKLHAGGWDALRGFNSGLPAPRKQELTNPTVGSRRLVPLSMVERSAAVHSQNVTGYEATFPWIHWRPAGAWVEHTETWHAERRGNAALCFKGNP